MTIIARSEASTFVKPASNGVCKMRTRSRYSYRSPGSGPYKPMTTSSWVRQTIDLAKVDPVPTAPAFKASDFTQEEMLALVSASEALRHQSIFFGLRERDKLGPLSGKVFASLRERGYVTRPDGMRFHKLTTEGIQIVNAVADHLVATKNLHWSYAGETGQRYDGYCACTCGWRRAISKFGLQANAARAFGTHLHDLMTKQAVG